MILMFPTGLHNMGGNPVTVIQDIRALLDIGRDPKNPREDYLDVYVFGVGPLVDSVNINALASKKDNEHHVFKVKDMEDLENVFYQMIGRKTQGCTRGSCRLRLPTSPTPKPSKPGRLALWPRHASPTSILTS